MSPENDQTRWIGIRPTDPSEDIPVTTKKILPAIADLQAIKGIYRLHDTHYNKNCTVSYTANTPIVDPGEIWVINNISARNVDSLCDMLFYARQSGESIILKAFFSIEPDVHKTWSGQCLLAEGDNIRILFNLGGAVDDLHFYVYGYKIGVY